ncbi:MAG: LysR family transcriptional regulator [Oscillospiraceae bacterium]|nr:LysR family transcriptional regulator [Oscillospiraceae bacterium]
MEKQQLRYFVEVARLEHITKAAEKLHISQPSVSLAIRRLEEEVGVPLFNREGRNIKINNYGKLFLETAVKVLNIIDEGQHKLDTLKFSENNHISISAPPWYIFPSLLKMIMDRFPGVTIGSVDYNHSDVVELFNRHVLDFCISTQKLETDSLNCICLRKDEMVLVVSKNNLLAARDTIALADCSELSFATSFKGVRQQELLVELCHERGFTPNILLEVHNVRDSISMIEHSDNIVALVPYNLLMARADNSHVHYLRLTDIKAEMELWMYWPKNYPEKAVAHDIRIAMKNYFINHEEELPQKKEES